MNKLKLHHILFTSSTYIINYFPIPKTINSNKTKQTISSQKHIHFYILKKITNIKIKTSIHKIYKKYQLIQKQKQIIIIYSNPKHKQKQK
ncbi:50S ribosomal protein L36 [Pseudomonas putida]|nr:50S ribosomal protein L36 [Pseudomonas putida]